MLHEERGLINGVLSLVGLPAVPWLQTMWGARVSLALLVIWAWLGYNMVLMLAGLQTIPQDLVEAALVDGANQVQAFFRITIPLMRPVILFSLVLSTFGSFSLFTENMVLFRNSEGRGPLNSTVTPIVAIFHAAFRDFDFGYASAMAYLFFALVFVLSLIQMRYINRER
jgi:ABC-type sugar transport system permease subunit